MQGGVRKKGCIWYYYHDVILDNGERKKIERAGTTDKKETEELLRESISKYEKGYIEPKKETIQEYMTRWLDDYIKPNRKYNTYFRYKGILDNYIFPIIGGIKLKTLNVNHIDKVLNGCKEGILKDKEGNTKRLSETSREGVYTVMNSCFNRAVKRREMPDNPCRFTDKPKRNKFRANTLTPEEFGKIIKEFNINKYNDYIFSIALMIELELGLRRGELAGIEWSDIDFVKKKLFVHNNLVYTDSMVIMGTTKTEESTRELTISDYLISLFKNHKKLQAENKLKLGPEYKANHFEGENLEDGLEARDYDLVLTWQDGKYIHPNYYTHRWARVTKSLKSKGIISGNVRFHDLRHTNATLLLSQGVDFKTLQKRLGHADIGTTMNIYADVMENLQRDATDKISNLLHG